MGGGVDHFLPMGGCEGLPAPSWIEVDLLEFLLISLYLVRMVALIGNKNLSPDTQAEKNMYYIDTELDLLGTF